MGVKTGHLDSRFEMHLCLKILKIPWVKKVTNVGSAAFNEQNL